MAANNYDTIDIDDDDDDLTPMESVQQLVMDKPECKMSHRLATTPILHLKLLGPAVAKWFVSSPEIMKKQEKARKTKEQRQSKCKPKQDDDNDESQPSKKKGKKKAKALDNDDEPLLLTCYIRVMKPAPTQPASHTRQPKLKPESLYILRGPFKFAADCTFEHFITLIAEILPCPAAHLVLDKPSGSPKPPQIDLRYPSVMCSALVCSRTRYR
jgi:hypothetical protein